VNLKNHLFVEKNISCTITNVLISVLKELVQILIESANHVETTVFNAVERTIAKNVTQKLPYTMANVTQFVLQDILIYSENVFLVKDLTA